MPEALVRTPAPTQQDPTAPLNHPHEYEVPPDCPLSLRRSLPGERLLERDVHFGSPALFGDRGRRRSRDQRSILSRQSLRRLRRVHERRLLRRSIGLRSRRGLSRVRLGARWKRLRANHRDPRSRRRIPHLQGRHMCEPLHKWRRRRLLPRNPEQAREVELRDLHGAVVLQRGGGMSSVHGLLGRLLHEPRRDQMPRRAGRPRALSRDGSVRVFSLQGRMRELVVTGTPEACAVSAKGHR